MNKENSRRKAVLAWGVLAGVAALITTAAFTDAIYLNFGTGNKDTGIGGGDGDKAYNIMVGALNADGTFKNDGTWIEADQPAGVDIKLPGADAIFPGAPASVVEIPVKNASKHITSTLKLKLVDKNPSKSDPAFLAALRFTVTMPATVTGSTPINLTDKTYADFANGLALNDLAALADSKVTVSVTLPDQGSPQGNNDLNGKAAYVQAILEGTSKA